QLGARAERGHPGLQPRLALGVEIVANLVRDVARHELRGPLRFESAAEDFERGHEIHLSVAGRAIEQALLALGELADDVAGQRSAITSAERGQRLALRRREAELWGFDIRPGSGGQTSLVPPG